METAETLAALAASAGVVAPGRSWQAVVAEEETLAEVTENVNLARRLDAEEGIAGILAAPHEFERHNGRVCHQGSPVSLLFMDFNNDVLLKLHRRHDLTPLLQAVRENRVLNPRGTEPINVKSMFEVLTGPRADSFDPETVRRTLWTRRFFPRRTTGPQGEGVADLVAWTRRTWPRLVLKPERGYSGIGVKVGGEGVDADTAVEEALAAGGYIVQEKVPLPLWGEMMPEPDHEGERILLRERQTDFRCLIGPGCVFGFLCRFGDVPTNVGSGGGVQPLAILRSPLSVGDPVVTRQEIDIFLALLPIAPGERILDLCGGHGRHALELSRRGYHPCIVLDYSKALLSVGLREAVRRRCPVRFVQGDARCAALAWHEIGDGVVVCRQREIVDDFICAREMVLSKAKGMIRDRTYCIRLCGVGDLTALVTRAGFDAVQVHPHGAQRHLGWMSAACITA